MNFDFECVGCEKVEEFVGIVFEFFMGGNVVKKSWFGNFDIFWCKVVVI